MDRYTLDYVWDYEAEHNPKLKLDIECFSGDGKTHGFDKDPDGGWVKYSDVQSLQSRIKELEGAFYKTLCDLFAKMIIESDRHMDIKRHSLKSFAGEALKRHGLDNLLNREK